LADLPKPDVPDLTFEFIVSRLRAVFPGVKLEIGQQVGGRQVRLKIWQFLVEVSFCEKKIAHVDEAGSARVTFKSQPEPKGTPVVTKTVQIRKAAEYQQFLDWVQAYLNGVLAAITQAMEQTRTPVADIFGGSDSR